MFSRITLIALALLPLPALAAPVPVYPAIVQATLPHDPQAFTEGLFIENGSLWESTGLEGHSLIRRTTPGSLKTQQEVSLEQPYFGEGIVAWKNRLIQLTWRSEKGFLYDEKTLTRQGTFSYSGEGWGLTKNETSIIMSDGTDTLRFLSPETLKTTATLRVTADGCPLARLNELEWVRGELYANIWLTDLIARISPKTGEVLSFIDVSKLGPDRSLNENAVANGIAWDSRTGKLYVTGKLWPQLYQITTGASPAAHISCHDHSSP